MRRRVQDAQVDVQDEELLAERCVEGALCQWAVATGAGSSARSAAGSCLATEKSNGLY